jgi:hypothetical protein
MTQWTFSPTADDGSLQIKDGPLNASGLARTNKLVDDLKRSAAHAKSGAARASLVLSRSPRVFHLNLLLTYHEKDELHARPAFAPVRPRATSNNVLEKIISL